jgi:hypothetical protein
LLTLREGRRLKVFESTALRSIFGPKRDEVTGLWIKLHNEELTDLYYSPNIVWVIKSRTVRMGGACSTYRGQQRCIQGFGGGNIRERDHLEDLGVDGRIILRRIFKKLDGVAQTALIWLGIGIGSGLLWMR